MCPRSLPSPASNTWSCLARSVPTARVLKGPGAPERCEELELGEPQQRASDLGHRHASLHGLPLRDDPRLGQETSQTTQPPTYERPAGPGVQKLGHPHQGGATCHPRPVIRGLRRKPHAACRHYSPPVLARSHFPSTAERIRGLHSESELERASAGLPAVARWQRRRPGQSRDSDVDTSLNRAA